MEKRVQQAEQERSAIDEFGVRGVSEARNKLGMQNAIDKSGNSEDETDQRSGSADIKQGAIRADGRADQDEGTERAGQVGEGNEKRVGRANVMIAAGKEMSEFVGEENGEKGERKGETDGEAERVFVKKCERAEKFVGGEGLVLRVGICELRAGHQTSTKREEEENASEDQHLSGRAVGDGSVANTGWKGGAPFGVERNRWRWIFWKGCGHEAFCAK